MPGRQHFFSQLRTFFWYVPSSVALTYPKLLQDAAHFAYTRLQQELDSVEEAEEKAKKVEMLSQWKEERFSQMLQQQQQEVQTFQLQQQQVVRSICLPRLCVNSVSGILLMVMCAHQNSQEQAEDQYAVEAVMKREQLNKFKEERSAQLMRAQQVQYITEMNLQEMKNERSKVCQLTYSLLQLLFALNNTVFVAQKNKERVAYRMSQMNQRQQEKREKQHLEQQRQAERQAQLDKLAATVKVEAERYAKNKR